jgi:hypothetical protein
MPLKISDGIGAWIKDFKKSDAPQFKGKDEKERRDMALAAYLDAKRGDKNENVRSADKKPEIYTKPDGKRGVRMVSTDRDVIKTKSESIKEVTPKSDVSELAMKTDPKIPNLKTPKDKKYNTREPLSKFKQAKKSGEIRREQQVDEETNFEVNIEGLPMMFMSGMGPGEVKQKLRKIVKQPSMIQSVKRVTDADVKKNFRLKAQGRDEEEQIDEEIKYTHVALDSKGKIAGLASKESDSVDMARRHKGKALKLKKPISQKRGDMMVNRAPGLVMGDAYIVKDFNEAKLDELSPATMNSYKRKASDDLYRSTNKYTSPISKPRNKKQRDALDKHVDKRKAGLNLVRKRSGTAGYQDESK